MSSLEVQIETGQNCLRSPLVSVIIPAYKVSEFIAETLDSAFAQTLNDFEIIVVNDGSPDTAQLETALEPYKDKLIYIVQENKGAAVARNTAIRHSSGKYLAFLDGDDIWHPDHLETQIKLIEKDQIDMIYCDGELFGETIKTGHRFSERSPSQAPVTTESLLSEKCNVLMCSTVAKKDAVVNVGMFDEEHERMPAEDFDLWFRLAHRGYKLGFHNGVTTKYRVRTNGLTGNSVQNATRTINVLSIIKEKYQLSENESAFLNDSLNNAYAYKAVELAKTNLVKRNFTEAIIDLKTANSHYHRLKYFAFLCIITIAPVAARMLFIMLWPEEAGAILNSD